MKENGLKMVSGKGFEVIRVETYVGNCVGNEKGFQFLNPETLVILAPLTAQSCNMSISPYKYLSG